VVAANEQCDDGNDLPFDGCYQCNKEPFCPNGACVSVCGDGLISQGEECDDGNNASGDGCSADCKLENIPGVYCSNVTSNLPSSITVPVIFRDFKGFPEAGGHPDFEHFHCTQSSPGLVQPTLARGSPRGRPRTHPAAPMGRRTER
jgi:cysteine-rich repeat protein